MTRLEVQKTLFTFQDTYRPAFAEFTCYSSGNWSCGCACLISNRWFFADECFIFLTVFLTSYRFHLRFETNILTFYT